MSRQSTSTIGAQTGGNSRVQKMTEKFETLITSQQQKQQVFPHQRSSVQNFSLKGIDLEHGSERSSAPSPNEPDGRRGIKRSQAFRRSNSHPGLMNSDNHRSDYPTTQVQLIHSDSIREALNKPLPPGPPPEKPPRFVRIEKGMRDTLNGEPVSEHYEDVNMFIEAAFREPEKEDVHNSALRENVSAKRPVSEQHRKRIRRLSRCAEFNNYTQQYGTLRVYDIVDDRELPVETVAKTSDAKGLIAHYNNLCAVETAKAVEKPLYNYCIVVGYNLMQNKPYVKCKYPPEKSPHKMIEIFVYPDNGAVIRGRDQEYSIIITDHPHRLYGFCRRVLPESSEFCIPLTYCFVTEYNEPAVFYKLLECIESQHGNGNVPELLMAQFYSQKLPLVGESLSISLQSYYDRRSAFPTGTLTISRPKDLRLEKTELFELFKCLGPDGLIEVFESLLLEKMVILFSEHLSLVSSCVQALLLILYPFQWQHILITIIPDHLQQMLEAPVPMLAGTLQPVPEQLWKSGDACYVNLDKRTVRPTKKDQLSILPNELRKPLRVSLELVKAFEDSKGLASVLIGGAFIRFFVELFCNLDTKSYEKSDFVAMFENPETKLFLNCFLETAMFKDFFENWHASKFDSSSAVSFDYSLFTSKIIEKSHNKYWHTATIDEVIANSKLLERKGKTMMAKVKNLLRKT